MWRIFRADLRYRGTMLLLGLLAVAVTGLVLYFASVPGTPVLHFVVFTAVLLPAILNLISNGTDEKEERILLLRQLPVARFGVEFIRSITPVFVQLLGTGVAISIIISGLQIHNSPAPGVKVILIVTAIMLLIGQLLSLQQILASICRGRTGFALIAASITVFAVAVHLALHYLFFSFLFRFPAVGHVHLDSGSTEIMALICTLTNSAIALFLANLVLFYKER